MGLKRLQRAYVRTFWAFTAADLCNALQRLGVERGDFLMVHSSFDKFLGFRGGPGEAIRALQDVVGPRGTLMMPTLPFTGSAIEYTSRDLVFDVRRTASRMGFITEVFRRGPEVVRSLHPTHSVAVWGNNVDAIVAGHHVAETPCGRPTPYGRLLEYDGKILFAGVPVSTMTFFHFVEEELEPRMPFPVFAPEGYALRWKDEAGAVGVSRMRLFSLRLAGHRDLNPLASELQRRKQWREGGRGRPGLILLRAPDGYDAHFPFGERGVFFFERLGLAGHERRWGGG